MSIPYHSHPLLRTAIPWTRASVPILTEPSLLGAVNPGDKIDQHGHDLQVPNLNNKPTLAIMVREHKTTEQATPPPHGPCLRCDPR